VSDNIIGTVMIRAGKDCHPPQVVYVRGKSKALTGAYTLNVLNESRNALAYRNDLTEFDLQDFEIEKACWDITESEKRLDRQHLRLQELTATPPTEEQNNGQRNHYQRDKN
jgi:hypothetical protein